ncbi:MAG: carbohydrate kinase family protein [Victivallales bacterium]|jgi:sugar/nucleoside kinase (ribokinase family)|nr:carbohydrate kinase family protein [Victivallales bacterium]
MERRGIVGAGNWIVDVVKTVDRWPGEGNLCNILKVERGGGGGPCNVLFDLSAMKSKIPLYAAGMLGVDAKGDFLLQEIKKRDIDSRFMFRTAETPSSFTDVISAAGRRTFFHNRGANALLSDKELLKVDVPAKIFYLGYLLLLDALDAPNSQFGTCGALALAEMRKRGFLTAVDFVSESPEKFRRTVLPALKHIDILVINELEAGHTFELEIRKSGNSYCFETLIRSARLFFEHGVNELVVIHFPEGALAMRKSGEGYFLPSWPVQPHEIVGTNGAGDAFCAGVLYGVHENLPLHELLKIATASATFNLSAATASGGAVSLDKMRKLLNSRVLAGKAI